MPILIVVVAASVWGLFWIPLRAFEANGLAAGWATFTQFAAPFLVLLPVALWRAARHRPTGAGEAISGLLVGGAFALYAESLLLTEVTRSLILFYVTPAWSTLLEISFMGRRLTRARALALTLGFAGLLTILGGKTGIPLPRNPGDWMALLSGMVWAAGTMRVRTAPEKDIFEHVFSFFLYGGAVALVMALLPIGTARALPTWVALEPLLPWLLLVSVGFLIPVTWGLLWGSKNMDPGRLGVLLQMEAVVGIASAALLTDEPFGWVELLGTILVVGAGIVDVLGGRGPKENTEGATI
jgi:drug/metabolite transporter (DMT)-like permease